MKRKLEKVLPQRFNRLLYLYKTIDSSYCFLTKRKVKCTISKILKIANSLIAPDTICHNDIQILCHISSVITIQDMPFLDSDDPYLPISSKKNIKSIEKGKSKEKNQLVLSQPSKNENNIQMDVQVKKMEKQDIIFNDHDKKMDGHDDNLIVCFPEIRHCSNSASRKRFHIFNNHLINFVDKEHQKFLDSSETTFDSSIEYHPDFCGLSTIISIPLLEKKEEYMEESKSREECCPSLPENKNTDKFDKLNEEKENSKEPSDDNCKVDTTNDTLEVDPWIGILKSLSFFNNQIFHVQVKPSIAPIFSIFPQWMNTTVRQALQNRGIINLYRHQSEAIEAIHSGYNLSICTGTSSGKSLVYNIPILSETWEDEETTSIYLFPTKALAQDQSFSLQRLIEGDLAQKIVCCTHDGDTCQAERKWNMDHANIFLTNPDMLHISILPYHEKWKRVLRNLKFLVLDEAHMYRGLFGAHVSNIIRRLLRLCGHYGTYPQIICCSATINNPKEHFEMLIPHIENASYSEDANLSCIQRGLSRTLVVVDQDTSPNGRKVIVLWNPAMKREKSSSIEESSKNHEVEKLRESPIYDTARLLAALVMKNIKTLAFCKVRKLVELVLKYTYEILGESSPELKKYVKAYRGGYTKSYRREIENELFSNNLLGVTATCALELGIDIGNLDATLHLGFPTSIASLWQQAGRCGRGGKDSLSIVIGFESAVDQYFLRNPTDLFQRIPEAACMDPFNSIVQRSQLMCAASELPFSVDDSSMDNLLFGKNSLNIIHELVQEEILQFPTQRTMGYTLHPVVQHPARKCNIRLIHPKLFTIIDADSNSVIDTVTYERVFYEMHIGAVFYHQGSQYLIRKFDLNNLKSYATKCSLPYYTVARENIMINVIRRNKSDKNEMLYEGDVQVVRHIYGYKKMELRTGKLLGKEDFKLPPIEYQTKAFWVDIRPDLMIEVEKDGLDIFAGIHAASHVMAAVVSLFALCDSNDVNSEHINPFSEGFHPLRVLVYETTPGGSGIANQAFHRFHEVLQLTLDVICGCSCMDGCPSCIHILNCPQQNEKTNKRASIRILKDILSTVFLSTTSSFANIVVSSSRNTTQFITQKDWVPSQPNHSIHCQLE